MSNREKKGFTMIELVIVIVIIAILASAGFVGGSRLVTSAREETAKTDLKNYELAFQKLQNEKNDEDDFDILKDYDKSEITLTDTKYSNLQKEIKYRNTQNKIKKLNQFLPHEFQFNVEGYLDDGKHVEYQSEEEKSSESFHGSAPNIFEYLTSSNIKLNEKDKWGNNYYFYFGKNNVILISSGEDRQANTNDDLFCSSVYDSDSIYILRIQDQVSVEDEIDNISSKTYDEMTAEEKTAANEKKKEVIAKYEKNVPEQETENLRKIALNLSSFMKSLTQEQMQEIGNNIELYAVQEEREIVSNKIRYPYDIFYLEKMATANLSPLGIPDESSYFEMVGMAKADIAAYNKYAAANSLPSYSVITGNEPKETDEPHTYLLQFFSKKKDPWGNPYCYNLPNTLFCGDSLSANKSRYNKKVSGATIVCAGKDGKYYTDDDLVLGFAKVGGRYSSEVSKVSENINITKTQTLSNYYQKAFSLIDQNADLKKTSFSAAEFAKRLNDVLPSKYQFETSEEKTIDTDGEYTKTIVKSKQKINGCYWYCYSEIEINKKNNKENDSGLIHWDGLETNLDHFSYGISTDAIYGKDFYNRYVETLHGDNDIYSFWVSNTCSYIFDTPFYHEDNIPR